MGPDCPWNSLFNSNWEFIALLRAIISCVPIVFSISRFVSVWKYLSIIQDLPEFSETISFPMGSLNNSYHTSFPVELNNTSLAEKGRIRLGFDGN